MPLAYSCLGTDGCDYNHADYLLLGGLCEKCNSVLRIASSKNLTWSPVSDGRMLQVCGFSGYTLPCWLLSSFSNQRGIFTLFILAVLRSLFLAQHWYPVHH